GGGVPGSGGYYCGHGVYRRHARSVCAGADAVAGYRGYAVVTAQEVDCLWCGAAFTRSRRWAYFCESCRAKRNRGKQETRDAARWYRLRHAAEAIAPTLELDRVPTLQQYVEELDLSEGEDLGLSPDRMPEGANTPYGPDEGRSTFFKDLSGELETLHKEASKAD